MDFRTFFRARKTTLIFAGALLLISGLILLVLRSGIFLPENTRFDGAGFSFEYPRVYTLTEHSRDSTTIGMQDFRSISPLVEVSIYRNDPESPTPVTYEAFIAQQARNLCGSDGGGESITCTNPVAKRVLTQKGLVGTELTLTLTRTNLATGTTTVGAYGPIYVFDYSYGIAAAQAANTSGGSSESADRVPPAVYKALFIYPSLSALLGGKPFNTLLDQVLGTLESSTIPIDPAFVPTPGTQAPSATPAQR